TAGVVAKRDQSRQTAAKEGAIRLQSRGTVGDWHGGALLDLHEGLPSCDKETAFREVGCQGWQRKWGRSRIRRRTRGRRIHARGKPLDGGSELGGERAGGPEGVSLTGIEPVVAAPGAEHHLRMLKKVAVDGDRDTLDGEGGGLQP